MSPASHPPEPADWFGQRAIDLEARARGGLAPGASSGRVHVRFRADALTAAEARVLELSASACAPGDLIDWHGSLAQLEGAIEREPGLAPLRAAWLGASRPPDRPRVMGVLNVTPDSFSDGGLYGRPEQAIARGLEMVAQGAEVIDVGGESTRPGSEEVRVEDELERVVPVIRGLADACDTPISVDTRRLPVARAALENGATLVNDTSAGRDDPELLPWLARTDCTYVLMHRQGTPADMQADPSYRDVLREVLDFLRRRAARALELGFETRRLLVDPGIGFGKRLEDNLELVRSVGELRSLGLGVLLGVSRKSFLAHLGAPDEARERTLETAAAVTCGALQGVEIHRVHEVEAMGRVIRVAHALAGGSPSLRKSGGTARISPSNPSLGCME